MPEPFDPYVQWLGLRATDRPLNYYQLLSLDDFEDNPQRIVTAADAALARVRSIRPGAERITWQKLLDELLLAKLCLLDPARKAQLDRQLQASQAAAPTPPTATSPQIFSEPPQIDPDLFPPGMGGPPPASPATPTAGPPPPDAFAPPPPAAFAPPAAPLPPAYAPPPPSYAAPPPSYAAPPPTYPAPIGHTSFPPMAPATSIPVQAAPVPPAPVAPAGVPVQPAGWAGWPMPAATAPAGVPQQPVAPIAFPSGPPAGVPQFGAPAGRGPSAAPIMVEPQFRAMSVAPPEAAAPHVVAPKPVLRAETADTPAPVKPFSLPAQPALATQLDPAPVIKPVSSQPVAMTKAANAPVPISARIEPLSGKQPTRPQNQLGLAIGAGVLVVIALAVMILKPPGGAEDEAKPRPSVATAHQNPVDKENSANPIHQRPVEEPDVSEAPDTKPAPDEPARPAPGPSRPRPKPRPVVKPSPKVEVAVAPPAGGGENPAPQPPTGDAAKSEAFRKALAQARGALAAREVDQAKQKLGAAGPLAQSDEEHTELERMNSLATYVAGFWNAVRESLKSLQITDELNYAGMVAAVVSSDTSGITLHTPGKNHEFTLKNMPPELAMTLATRWFDQSPGNKIALGAFLAVDPRGNKEEARRLWQQVGGPALDLMPLLSGAGGSANSAVDSGNAAAPPGERQQAVAAKQVKQTFQAEYKGAKTPELKLELGKKLLDVAGDTDNPTERFALLHEALDLAAAGGSPALIVEAVDQIASSFTIDPLEFKADALARAANATGNATVAKEITRAALGLLSEAIKENRAKPAGKLSQAAMNAARKSKDAELVKAATQLNQQAQQVK